MATNDCNGLIGWVGSLEFGNKSRGTDNIEGGDTEETLGIVDTFGLVNFGANGDCRVDLGKISVGLEIDHISILDWR